MKFVELLGEAGILQHGICFMLWDTFLRQPFRYIYDFLNRKSSKFKKLDSCRMDLASVYFLSIFEHLSDFGKNCFAEKTEFRMHSKQLLRFSTYRRF